MALSLFNKGDKVVLWLLIVMVIITLVVLFFTLGNAQFFQGFLSSRDIIDSVNLK